MADFATLILGAETAGLKAGETALDSLAAKAGTAEAKVKSATTGMSTALGKVPTAASQAVPAINAMESAMQGAAVSARTSADQVAAAADRQADALIRVAAAANRTAVPMKAGAGNARMFGQQLSQIAQQGAVTGNYLGALAVQLPDLALGFGGVAIAASIVATVAMPLLINAFGSGKSAAEKAREANEAWGDSLDALGGHVDAAKSLHGEYVDAMKSGNTELMRLIELEATARQAQFEIDRIGQAEAAKSAQEAQAQVRAEYDATVARGLELVTQQARLTKSLKDQQAAVAKGQSGAGDADYAGQLETVKFAIEENLAVLIRQRAELDKESAAYALIDAQVNVLNAKMKATGDLINIVKNGADDTTSALSSAASAASAFTTELSRAIGYAQGIRSAIDGMNFSNIARDAEAAALLAGETAAAAVAAGKLAERAAQLQPVLRGGPDGMANWAKEQLVAYEASLAAEVESIENLESVKAGLTAVGAAGGAAGKAITDALTAAEQAAVDFAQTLSDSIKGAVDKSVDWLFGGFQGGFKSLLDGWKDTLSEMASEAAKSRLNRYLFGVAADAKTGAPAIPGVLGQFASVGANGAAIAGQGFLGALQASLSKGFGNIFNISANIEAAGGGMMASLGAIAAPLALVAGLFAAFRKQVSVVAQGMNIEIANGQALAETFKTVKTTSFFGLFSKTTTTTAALDAGNAANLNQAYDDLANNALNAAKALGISASVFDSFTYSLSLNLAGLSSQDAASKVNEALGGVANALAELALAGVAVPTSAGGAAQFLQDIASGLTAVNTASRMLGFETMALSIASGIAAGNIVKVYGSLDAFSQATSFYFKNFYSEQEQTVALTAELQRQLSDLGITSMPATVEEFRALVDAAQAAGDATLAAKLINLADEFITMKDVADAAADAVSKAAEALFGFTDEEAYRTLFEFQKAQALGPDAYAKSAPLPAPFIGAPPQGQAQASAAMTRRQEEAEATLVLHTNLLMDLKKLTSRWNDTFNKWDATGMPPVRAP